jgi:hypothetical protein
VDASLPGSDDPAADPFYRLRLRKKTPLNPGPVNPVTPASNMPNATESTPVYSGKFLLPKQQTILILGKKREQDFWFRGNQRHSLDSDNLSE